MNKIDKFRGLLEVNVNGETFLLNSLKVNDLFDLLLLQKQDKDQFKFGVDFLVRVFSKSFPDDTEGLEQFCISNYVTILEELMIALGWTTREKLEALKAKEEDKKPSSEKNIMLFKARMAKEVESQDIEDRYITTCYVLMKTFKYQRDHILDMDASVFLILIDELNKQNEKEKEEMNKNKTLRKH